MTAPVTPDGRYIVVEGRLWRSSNPRLSIEARQALVDELMDARRAVRAASGAEEALKSARARVHAAKEALGERGQVWWDDGAPDLSRRSVENSHYAQWWAAENGGRRYGPWRLTRKGNFAVPSALLIAFALASAPAAPAPAAVDIGAEPTVEVFAALAEPELLRKLKKPQPVAFEWPYRLVAGPIGYYTCGLARKPGGKGRDVWTTAVVARGQLVSARWATPDGLLEYECKRQVKKGLLVAR